MTARADDAADAAPKLAEAVFRETTAAIEATIGSQLGAIAAAADSITLALARGGKVLVFGNGGSAAEAQHFAAELVGRFERERQALAAVALTTDTSILTAVANDYAFERVFARQVEALGRPGDVAFGISTSGQSSNVIAGLREARARQLVTVALSGRDGGDMGQVADVHVCVPHPTTARIQEVQLMVLHAICAIVERAASGWQTDTLRAG